MTLRSPLPLFRAQARNVKPTVVTYGTTMKALADAGRHVEALQLLETMRKVACVRACMRLPCSSSLSSGPLARSLARFCRAPAVFLSD